jgi:hypothetical protein
MLDRLFVWLADRQDAAFFLAGRLRVRLHRLWMCRRGHTDILRVEPPGRIYVQCTTCGRQTPGWAQGGGPQPRRWRLERPQ